MRDNVAVHDDALERAVAVSEPGLARRASSPGPRCRILRLCPRPDWPIGELHRTSPGLEHHRTMNACWWRVPSRVLAIASRLPTLFRAGASEEMLDRVVAFVALHAEHSDVGRVERPLRGPCRGPGLGIVDGDPVAKNTRTDFGESLDDVQPLPGTEVARVGSKVRRVDDQRVAVPVADRITEPLADRCRQV